NVVNRKADVVFAEPFSVHEFMENNPDTLQQVAGEPLTLVPNIMLIKGGQSQFKTMINNALTELFLNGIVDKAIDKYEKYPDSYVRHVLSQSTG
ncbi:MAG: transporter substrate-binding domain-containing protein, partial [Gammaproteobacteria bacterium]|nr:transporter substrate-binding domain-containing protein [Gammaproteobacteria bacterium]